MDCGGNQDTRIARPRVVYRSRQAGRPIRRSKAAGVSEAARWLRPARAGLFVECRRGRPSPAHLVTPLRSGDPRRRCMAKPEGDPRLARTVAPGCLDLRSTRPGQPARLGLRFGPRSRQVVPVRATSCLRPLSGGGYHPPDGVDRSRRPQVCRGAALRSASRISFGRTGRSDPFTPANRSNSST